MSPNNHTASRWRRFVQWQIGTHVEVQQLPRGVSAEHLRAGVRVPAATRLDVRIARVDQNIRAGASRLLPLERKVMRLTVDHIGTNRPFLLHTISGADVRM